MLKGSPLRGATPILVVIPTDVVCLRHEELRCDSGYKRFENLRSAILLFAVGHIVSYKVSANPFYLTNLIKFYTKN